MLGRELTTPIARGRTAEIYAWDTRHVLKLFFAGWPAYDAMYEAKVANAVHASGFPVPGVKAVVEHSGRYGIIYERVDGPSLLRLISTRPWRLLYAARLLARLHVAVHDHRVANLPSQRDRLTYRLAATPLLTEDTRQRLLAQVATMPEEDRLCHGDFHPNNVLLTTHGPVIIDWNDATRGLPAADVARSTLLMRDTVLPPDMPRAWLIKLLRGLFYRAYRRHYLKLRPQVVRESAGWEPIVAAVRLSEDVVEAEAQRLLQIAGSALQNTLA